jgi:hypothetical protein
MRVEESITASWAEQLKVACSEQVIAEFKDMREPMLSGDSGLLNIWEGGFKSEVQHLPPSKVSRCKAAHPSAINNSSLRIV